MDNLLSFLLSSKSVNFEIWDLRENVECIDCGIVKHDAYTKGLLHVRIQWIGHNPEAREYEHAKLV